MTPLGGIKKQSGSCGLGKRRWQRKHVWVGIRTLLPGKEECVPQSGHSQRFRATGRRRMVSRGQLGRDVGLRMQVGSSRPFYTLLTGPRSRAAGMGRGGRASRSVKASTGPLGQDLPAQHCAPRGGARAPGLGFRASLCPGRSDPTRGCDGLLGSVWTLQTGHTAPRDGESGARGL